MRPLLLIANWKMNLGRSSKALSLVRRLRPKLSAYTDVEVVLCPPATVLTTLAEVLDQSKIALGAQNIHWESAGAHTGELSPTMLVGLAQYVIVGHSERRATAALSENDEAVNRKLLAAVDHGLIPILCVGEQLEQRQAGATSEIVGGQVVAALAGLSAERAVECVIAYEPIWAIGSGRPATPADGNRTIELSIRGVLAEIFDPETARALRVLYGGSVNAGNIADFVAMPSIDGALIGGASLDEGFVDLVKNARDGARHPPARSD
jgi:triosephosphate isomerase